MKTTLISKETYQIETEGGSVASLVVEMPGWHDSAEYDIVVEQRQWIETAHEWVPQTIVINRDMIEDLIAVLMQAKFRYNIQTQRSE